MKLQQPMNRSRRRFVSTGLVLAGASLAPWSVRASQPAQPFRLGALNSITGVGGPYGGAMLEAIRIAVDEVNAAGGAAGRQIQLYARTTRPSRMPPCWRPRS